MSDLVLLEWSDPVAQITLNRPDRHNSLVPEMLESYLDSLQSVQERPSIGALLLKANGRSFSTGGDLLGFYEHRQDLVAYADQLVGLLNQVILRMFSLTIPIIAAVHAQVTGGSIGFLLASDIIIATPQVAFTPYYSVVGFSPDGGWTAILPEVIGTLRTKFILLTNQTITAEQAVRWGLISQLVDPDSLLCTANQIALQCACGKSGSLVSTKILLERFTSRLENRLDNERRLFLEQIQQPEAMDGICKFLGIEV